MSDLQPLFDYLDEIDALDGAVRHAALIEFARGPLFSAAALLEQGALGRISREAWALLSRELDEDSPARAWDRSWSIPDRAVICRHLKIDRADPLAFYATFPFRIIRPEGERPWIAGAVGGPHLFDADHMRRWLHIDIADVILWNPRTNEVRLAGDAGASIVECADYADGRYTVFNDGFSFFRAWADHRAALGASIQAARTDHTRIVPREPADGGLPGILVIGDLAKVRWPHLGASVLVAGPGIDAVALKRAVFRAARLPRIEEHRKAA